MPGWPGPGRCCSPPGHAWPARWRRGPRPAACPPCCSGSRRPGPGPGAGRRRRHPSSCRSGPWPPGQLRLDEARSAVTSVEIVSDSTTRTPAIRPRRAGPPGSGQASGPEASPRTAGPGPPGPRAHPRRSPCRRCGGPGVDGRPGQHARMALIASRPLSTSLRARFMSSASRPSGPRPRAGRPGPPAARPGAGRPG